MKHSHEPETSPCLPAADEVWLKGNPRPAVALCAAMMLAAVAAGAAVAVWRPAPWIAAVVAAACAVGVVVGAGLVWVASRPRLARRGNVLEIRLSPLGVERVPLDIVECVFPGSQPLGGDDNASADRRVGTLVLRLAERASDWRSRPVAAAWGEWEEGNVVFDGRWCEPLSQAVARDLSGRLLEARRGLGGETP
jgi:hypothetical protein